MTILQHLTKSKIQPFKYFININNYHCGKVAAKNF